MKYSNWLVISIMFLNISCSAADAQTKSPWDELTARASKFVQQQNMNAAEPILIQALAEAKKTPTNQLRLAKSNENLGWLYFRQGKYLKAQPFLKQALTIAEKSHDSEVVQIGIAVVEALAFMDLQQGKYREAESLYSRLSGASITLPELNPIIKVSGILGKCNVLSAEGRYSEVHQLLNQSQTEIAKFVPPPLPTGKPADKKQFVVMLKQAILHGFIMAFRKRLIYDQVVAQGNLYLAEGNLDQAESCFRKGTDQFRRDFQKEAPAIILGYIGLGKTCLQRGKLSDAQDYFQRSKTILERDSIQERPFVETCQINIADIQTRKGQYQEAQNNFNTAKSSLEQNLGAETVPVSDCWLGLGNIARATGKDSEAEANYRKALAIKEKLFGANSVQLGPVLNPLAALLEKNGREPEARALYSSCIESHEKRSLSSNIQACKAMIGQANLEKKSGQADKAEPLYRNALNSLERNLLPSDPLLLDTYKNLGEIYLSQNKMPEAESVLKRELAGLDRLQKQDSDLMLALNSLASAQIAQQKWSDAEAVLQRELKLQEIYPEFRGKNDSALKDYPELLKKLNKESESERVLARIQSLNESSKTASDGKQ
ncbi:MAG: tetratricopeptide repeat protein [Candidatus Obscuribacterales bacterium]|nr:tetratricopeptide repeat protein [Candidatus Obscuribacterales bacterium]